MFDVKNSTVEQVVAEVESGRLSAEDAITAEKAKEPVRSSLVERLERLAKPTSPQSPSPSTTAASVSANESAEDDAKRNPNGYERVAVKTSEKVNANTGGLGTYFDPEMKQSIGKERVTVYATPFVEGLLRSQELARG